MRIDLNWFQDQVRAFQQVRPKYDQMASVLRRALQLAAGPHAALVQVRVKSIPSFSEKILRKRGKYHDPVNQLTDLCGARVIVHTHAEVEEISQFVKRHFEVDAVNSLDASSRLKATEFGYRSVHYVVQLRPADLPDGSRIEVPGELASLKAEIQVRTIAQHAWADIGHDRIYKSPFALPEWCLRDSARIAALLEDADQAFSRLVERMDTFRASFGAFMTTDQMKEERELLTAVREFDKGNLELIQRIARIGLVLDECRSVADLLENLPLPKSSALLLCEGIALARLHAEDRKGEGYLRSRQCLEQAVATDPRNVEAIVHLAESWIGLDEDKAGELFKRAFEVDATDPRALSGYVRFMITRNRSLEFMSLLRPSLEAAVERCQARAAVGVDLPWALFHSAEFKLLLRRPYEALADYSRAVSCAHSQLLLEQAIDTIQHFQPVRRDLPEAEWARRFLLLAKATRFPQAQLDPRLKAIATRAEAIKPPVVIVAGGCDASAQRRIDSYRELMMAAFRDFRGTVISGGTTAGVSGLVGELTEAYPGNIRSIGYLPARTPNHVTLDSRYSEIREMEGTNFSAMEPLQNWIDLLASGVKPADVRLLGIDGGVIAGFEFRLALALGAKVAVFRESGREASLLARDAAELQMPGLAVLPSDTWTVRLFLQEASRTSWSAKDLDIVSQAIHERYREDQARRKPNVDPAMVEWEALDEKFKESNRQQALHISQKLAAIGRQAVPVREGEVRLVAFTEDEVEILAEMEHARWNVERLLAGWTLGERDPAAKRSPYLTAWHDLPADVQDWDRNTVREIPEFLKAIGLEIQPLR